MEEPESQFWFKLGLPLIGIILIKGGNHKLVCSLAGAQPSSEAVINADLKNYIRAYAALHPNFAQKRIRYLQLVNPWEIDDEALGGGAGCAPPAPPRRRTRPSTQ